MVSGGLSQPWFRTDPHKLATLREYLAQHFASLHALENDGTIVIVGTYHLIEDGVRIESFSLHIALPPKYPIGLPVAREVGGRIPRNIDHHINVDGTLCVGLPEELWLEFGGRLDVQTYLQGPLRSYFVGAAHKLRGAPWPYGEWPHGAAGLREFYGKAIGTTEHAQIVQFVTLLAGDPIKGHHPCPLGCGGEIRRCHLQAVKSLQMKLPSGLIRRSLETLSAQ